MEERSRRAWRASHPSPRYPPSCLQRRENQFNQNYTTSSQLLTRNKGDMEMEIERGREKERERKRESSYYRVLTNRFSRVDVYHFGGSVAECRVLFDLLLNHGHRVHFRREHLQQLDLEFLEIFLLIISNYDMMWWTLQCNANENSTDKNLTLVVALPKSHRTYIGGAPRFRSSTRMFSTLTNRTKFAKSKLVQISIKRSRAVDDEQRGY